jgi:hypothetical protein
MGVVCFDDFAKGTLTKQTYGAIYDVECVNKSKVDKEQRDSQRSWIMSSARMM